MEIPPTWGLIAYGDHLADCELIPLADVMQRFGLTEDDLIEP